MIQKCNLNFFLFKTKNNMKLFSQMLHRINFLHPSLDLDSFPLRLKSFYPNADTKDFVLWG